MGRALQHRRQETWQSAVVDMVDGINGIGCVPVRTAQGGGESFKDRKPIGKIGCCESWMADQNHSWIERRLERRPMHLSIYLPVYRTG